ncbi:polyhydroxyalkanoic acid system family protein [Altericroceibacterium endophyticum]|uniref:Polyhydroxyalkanoic acid synthase n=1 Tax=Altericroceibacterium endophyticum TaxID=1808508 RepID=A0A6I4T543_9SPHN|nr:polyhydroxyalkanoic acid system family protein [Altericroceibacterium endophyticum]MXO65271.1 hypothetical protein [Altericroceibacterium endophyticum]
MRVVLPHELTKEALRERLRSHAHEIADHIPGGMAEVETHWPNEDRMQMMIRAMGQNLSGDVEIEAQQVVFTIVLPPALGVIEPLVENAIRKHSQTLLAPPKA